MAGVAGTDCAGVGLVPAEHRRVAERLGRGPRGCNTPQQGQHHRQVLVLARAGARDEPPQRYPHNTGGNCLRSSSAFIESKSRSSSKTQTFFINLTPWAFQQCLDIVTDKGNACGRRGLRSCCSDCVSLLPPARGGGEGVSSPFTITESGFGPTVSRKQALSPSETRLLFFCNFKCTSRKPSFMAIIAQLITLWRLQTCVIYIFPSSHLARRLENASMRRVNLAITQPSPFSPATLLQTRPVLVLSGQSQPHG